MRRIFELTIAFLFIGSLLFTGCVNGNTGAPSDDVNNIPNPIPDSVVDEKKTTELAIIQQSVLTMMVDNNLKSLAGLDYVGKSGGSYQKPTNDMGMFPVPVSDGNGYVLYQHVHQDGSIINYLVTPATIFYYSVNEMGSVTQYENPD